MKFFENIINKFKLSEEPDEEELSDVIKSENIKEKELQDKYHKVDVKPVQPIHKTEKNKALKEIEVPDDIKNTFKITLLFDHDFDFPGSFIFYKYITDNLGKAEIFTGSNVIKLLPTDYDNIMFNEHPTLFLNNKKETFTDENVKEELYSNIHLDTSVKDMIRQCKYSISGFESYTYELDTEKKALLLMRYSKALLQIFPKAKGIIFNPSGTAWTREQFLDESIPEDVKFAFFAVNPRLFTIKENGYKIIDTVGMSALDLPDLQYCFRYYDCNDIVFHGQNIANYMIHNNSLDEGSIIDGLLNGEICTKVHWSCRLTKSLVEPERNVVFVNMRDYESRE